MTRKRRRYRLRKDIALKLKQVIRCSANMIGIAAVIYVANDLQLAINPMGVMENYLIKREYIEMVGEKDQEKVVAKIKELNDINDFYRKTSKQPIRSYHLRNFTLEANKLPFGNISTEDSNGICNAMSLFEKYNYLDQLDQIKVDQKYLEKEAISLKTIQSGDLSRYSLSDEQKNYLYRDQFLTPNPLNIEYEEMLFRRKMAYYDDHTENMADRISDTQLANLFNWLNYLQDSLGTTNWSIQRYEMQPCFFGGEGTRLRQIVRNKNSKKVQKLEVEKIIAALESDIPVLMAIWNGEEGHSLLAYGYEEIEEGIIKLYVSDSNIPLSQGKKGMTKKEEEEVAKYNQDVKQNVYILLRMNQAIDKWEYVYNPYVNERYFYGDMPYHFYIPNQCIEMEKIELRNDHGIKKESKCDLNHILISDDAL